MNALDKAIADMKRGPVAQPELYRRLSEGELWMLIPWRPGIEGTEVEFKQGAPLSLVALPHKEGQVIPIYSSEERMAEGLSRGRVPPDTYAGLPVPAKTLLGSIGEAGFHASVNFYCATTGQVELPPDVLRKLGDGSALKPVKITGRRPKAKELLDVIQPADYPTAIVQPLFEHFKQHRNFRAAWIFEVPKSARPPGGARHFKVLVEMEPRDDALYHDAEIVMSAMPKDGSVISGGLLNEKDRRAIARMFRQAQPFFVATDYEQPGGEAK